MTFLASLTFISAVVLAGSKFVIAQEQHHGFLMKCSPGKWAMTWDDGPGAYTEELRLILKKEKVKVSLFLVGEQLNNPTFAKYAKDAYNDGHLIASHSWNHTDFNTITVAQIKDQMKRTEDRFMETLSVKPNYMRPPYGNCNATCAAIMKELGYTVVQWSVDSNDWRYAKHRVKPKQFAEFAAALKHRDLKTDGHISLQHDIHQFSVKMAPQIIKEIREKGFEFVTVDKCNNARVPPYRERVNATTSPAPGRQSPVMPVPIPPVPSVGSSLAAGLLSIAFAAVTAIVSA